MKVRKQHHYLPLLSLSLAASTSLSLYLCLQLLQRRESHLKLRFGHESESTVEAPSLQRASAWNITVV